MYNKDQVNTIDRLIAERIILCALDKGYLIRVHDGEGWDGQPSGDFVDIVEKLFQADSTGLYVYPSGLSRQHIGWVSLVGGESGWDVISDYATAMEPLVKEAETLANEFENGTRSPVVDRHYYIERTLDVGPNGTMKPTEYVVKLGQHEVLFETRNQLEAAWRAHKLNTGEIVV